jgi:hypothetical protein
MRTIRALAYLLVLAWPSLASGQSIEIYGGAGPTVTDEGHSMAAGVGYSPISPLTIAFGFERTHLSTRITRDGPVESAFRGGTLYLGTAEVRYAPLGRDRFGPYALGGLALGVSRPNVNDRFPRAVTNRAQVMFVGGGVQVPLGARAALLADARMLFGAEGNEGIVAVAPVRVAMAWRF